LFQVLNEHYAEHIEVRDAARICAMSPSYFMRFFKLTTGQSFRAYLNGFRIEKAQSMLSCGNTSIAAISQQVGFCSQSYFGEVFRVSAGMTPRAFRRRFGNKNQLPRESDLLRPPTSSRRAMAAQV
jgi:AraC-like DNA-binding protein